MFDTGAFGRGVKKPDVDVPAIHGLVSLHVDVVFFREPAACVVGIRRPKAAVDAVMHFAVGKRDDALEVGFVSWVLKEHVVDSVVLEIRVHFVEIATVIKQEEFERLRDLTEDTRSIVDSNSPLSFVFGVESREDLF